MFCFFFSYNRIGRAYFIFYSTRIVSVYFIFFSSRVINIIIFIVKSAFVSVLARRTSPERNGSKHPETCSSGLPRKCALGLWRPSCSFRVIYERESPTDERVNVFANPKNNFYHRKFPVCNRKTHNGRREDFFFFF